MAKQYDVTQSSVFLRPVSGLVKAAGLWDVFIYNVGLISVGIGVAYTQRFGPAYYPNSSIPIATLLAAGLMTLVVLGFWVWTITIPRSGGIYVFLTRARFPAFGFALSFVECVSWLFYVAIAAKLITTVGMIPLAALISSPSAPIVSWLSTSTGQLVVASAIIWLAALLLISGTHSYLKAQRIVFLVAIVGTVALLVVIGMANTPSTFRSNFNQVYADLGSDAYSQVLSQARSLGWVETVSQSFGKSIALLVWPFLPLIGSAFSIGIGGEVRNTKRNQLLGMLGSLAFCAVAFVVIAIYGNTAIGTDFQGAIGFNFDNAGSAGVPPASTPFEPYFSYLAGLATNSIILRILIPVGFLSWVWFWIPGVLAYTERAFLAWALDRAAPSPLAALHSRFATPYIAVLTGAGIAQVFLVLILYTNFFATLIFILAATVAWCITLLLGVVFPYIVPNIFQGSPIARTKLLGIPLMSVFCAVGACALGVVTYLLWNDSLAAGHSPKSLTVIGLTFSAGFIFYLGMKGYRKREGIDLARAYKEIPVE
jgi:APA family basic amino acid/polyamine antiporter